MTKKKKAKVAKVAKVKEVATSSAKPTSIRVGKVKQRIVEEEKTLKAREKMMKTPLNHLH